jgi:hypothetical protein
MKKMTLILVITLAFQKLNADVWVTNDTNFPAEVTVDWDGGSKTDTVGAQDSRMFTNKDLWNIKRHYRAVIDLGGGNRLKICDRNIDRFGNVWITISPHGETYGCRDTTYA